MAAFLDISFLTGQGLRALRPAAFLVLFSSGRPPRAVGAGDKPAPKPPFLGGAPPLFGGTVPTYTILVVVIAPIVAALLWYLLYRPKTGKVIRATSSDREVAEALGINMKG